MCEKIMFRMNRLIKIDMQEKFVKLNNFLSRFSKLVEEHVWSRVKYVFGRRNKAAALRKRAGPITQRSEDRDADGLRGARRGPRRR